MCVYVYLVIYKVSPISGTSPPSGKILSTLLPAFAVPGSGRVCKGIKSGGGDAVCVICFHSSN